MIEESCRKCGKMFIPAPMHSLRDDKGFYCSCTCFLHRERPKNNSRGKCKKVAMCDRHWNEIKAFPSVTKAAEYVGVEPVTIRAACVEERMSQGFLWKYKGT